MSVSLIWDGCNGRMDGIGHISHIILIQSRHTDASCFQQVNMEFTDQQQNLFLCKKRNNKISRQALASESLMDLILPFSPVYENMPI